MSTCDCVTTFRSFQLRTMKIVIFIFFLAFRGSITAGAASFFATVVVRTSTGSSSSITSTAGTNGRRRLFYTGNTIQKKIQKTILVPSTKNRQTCSNKVCVYLPETRLAQSVNHDIFFDSIVAPTIDNLPVVVSTTSPATIVSSTTQYISVIDFVEVSKNIGIAIVSITLVIVGILYFFANVIIPSAAVELEKQLRELDPELFQEFESKLQPGETLATRPDLIQELGTKLRQLQMEEFNKNQAQAQAQSQSQQQSQQQQQQQSQVRTINVESDLVDGLLVEPMARSTTTSRSKADVIDIEIVKDDDDTEKK